MANEVNSFDNIQSMIIPKPIFDSMDMKLGPNMEVRTKYNGYIVIIEDKTKKIDDRTKK